MYKNKKSPAKRSEPAPRACQPLAITTTPPLHCAEGLTGFYSPAFSPAKTSIFKTQFLEITEVVCPVTPALLLIHIERSVLQVSCRKLREY